MAKKSAAAEVKRFGRELTENERAAIAIEEPPPLLRYRVGLDCPTPVGQNPCEVEASSEEQARREFLARNGLSDSEWPFTIERL